jgi:hypothetical protein
MLRSPELWQMLPQEADMTCHPGTHVQDEKEHTLTLRPKLHVSEASFLGHGPSSRAMLTLLSLCVQLVGGRMTKETYAPAQAQ